MRLGAVVLIQNAAGCVCQPREEPPASPSAPAGEPRAALDVGGAAVAGGALVIALQPEAQRQTDGASQPVAVYVPPSAGPGAPFRP